MEAGVYEVEERVPSTFPERHLVNQSQPLWYGCRNWSSVVFGVAGRTSGFCLEGHGWLDKWMEDA